MILLASASLYCISMVAMKSWWTGPSSWTAGLIVLALLSAAFFEVVALRHERLGMVYVGILGAEVIIIGIASTLLFGETFSLREVVGIGLVVIGTALAWA